MTITLERRDNTTALWFDRPERLNAVNTTDFALLSRLLREIGDDTNCRAVVLAGRGRAFCAGLDLTSGFGDAKPARVPTTYAELRRGVEAVRLMRSIPQPIVAGVHGHAIGAGFAFACAADLRIASPTAVFGAPFTRLGMTPGDLGLSWLLPRLVGASVAASLFFRSGSITGSQAHHFGLVTELADDPVTLAFAVAGEIAEQAPLAVRQAKELLNASLLGGFHEHLEIELRSQVLCAMSEDHAEAKAAFAEHRHPVFRDA